MLSHAASPAAVFASGLPDPETVCLETMDFSSMNFLSWFLESSEHLASSALCSRTFPGLNVFDWKNFFIMVAFWCCITFSFLKPSATEADLSGNYTLYLQNIYFLLS